MGEANGKDPAVIRLKLNQDTAKIAWSALHEHQQQDSVIEVSTDLDLIDVACEFALDNSEQVRAWLEQARIAKVSDEQALEWSADDRQLWAVVVAPWVLVQLQKPGTN